MYEYKTVNFRKYFKINDRKTNIKKLLKDTI